MRDQKLSFPWSPLSQVADRLFCLSFRTSHFLFRLQVFVLSDRCEYIQQGYSVLFQIACCKTVGRLSKCANSTIIQVYLCLGPLQCTLKNVLACRIFDIISSSSVIWLYSLVRTLTARTMLASIQGASTVNSLKGGIVSPTPKPYPGGPGNLLSGYHTLVENAEF